MNILKTILSDLSTPDNFSRNWYGYATNQISHTALGFIAASMVAFVWFCFLGEFAPKEYSWALTASVYAAWELRKPSWDSLEDFIFFAIYGAGSATMLFSEVSPGSPQVTTEIGYIPKFTAIIATHLMVGIVARIIKNDR